MNAYRIQNAIVAAPDEQSAIAAWAEHFNEKPETSGPVEPVPQTLEIQVQEEDGSFRDGSLDEVMPADGDPQVVCTGECDC